MVWANPDRVVNRAFFSFSLHAGVWLFCVEYAVGTGEQERWVRLASAFGASITPHMWLLKEAILRRKNFWRGLPKWKYAWFGSAVVLAALCYTHWYLRPTTTAGQPPRFGPGYFVSTITILLLYGTLWWQTRNQIRRHTGVNRLELQILLLGGTVTAFAVIALMALRAVLGEVWPIELQPFVVLVLWVATVIAITTRRVLDAHQIVVFAVQKLTVVLLASVAAFAVDRLLRPLGMPGSVNLFVTVAAAWWFASAVNARMQHAFQFYPEAIVARQVAFAAAQRETRLDNLAQAFRNVLQGWGKSEHVILDFGSKSPGNGTSIATGERILTTLRELKWATPERLVRERSTTSREEVAQFLAEKELGILVLAEGPALTVLAGVGPSATRVPYTYPQVTQLVELASIMESALERAHFSQKVQHAEQLATVGLLGASMAHEIRNPLVTIKTFVQLLPAHYQDAAFRDKFFRLIADEVDRIDRLTEQLLDLASPRTYSAGLIELHPVLRASIDLVATKAAHRDVQIVADFAAAPDVVYTDAAAAKQVMLNLCFNAIQAIDGQHDGERRLWIRTRNAGAAVEVAVTDSGPGIAPEMMSRLFQPFQTTKSSGFGLGLAICSDILANLNATIAADPPVAGNGATFRVTFPCQPSLS